MYYVKDPRWFLCDEHDEGHPESRPIRIWSLNKDDLKLTPSEQMAFKRLNIAWTIRLK